MDAVTRPQPQTHASRKSGWGWRGTWQGWDRRRETLKLTQFQSCQETLLVLLRRTRQHKKIPFSPLLSQPNSSKIASSTLARAALRLSTSEPHQLRHETRQQTRPTWRNGILHHKPRQLQNKWHRTTLLCSFALKKCLTSFPLASPIDTQVTGKPCTKLVVPSIGSTIHVRALSESSSGAPPRSADASW